MTPEQLVEKFWDGAMAVAASFVSKNRSLRQHSDELRSRASEALWRSAQRFTTEHHAEAKFWTYAKHRVHGACLDYCRELHSTWLVNGPKAKVVPFTDLANEDGFCRQPELRFSAQMGPIADFINESQWANLTRCLTSRHRDILRLRFESGRSYSEIGRLFGIRPNRVMSIVRQSIKRILSSVRVAA
ncbi:sigma-70 family RNA polymerase sigma factor [Tuwongella immobilis]|uniref:Rna polymerase sigma 70:: Sigma70_r4 n=1 Tax=Tuwongella immobilis TaxID=692036 RepID=A0A6C2YLZ5_9BACT|nr:sigma-70 family RNA polymerase sigma factor [Tuwongella immobilis]VIP02143.1 rna polymerase sigma 70 : : Sigma70_r4 [Tuwongella immobilis]VTS00516.1 rna polymerase sigma 70 : : Sigma70_r4 [Tuwongella immobilis]